MNARLLTAACATLALGACSITDKINETGRIDYRSQAPVRATSLEVPPDLVSPRGDDRYAIPERAQKERTFSGYQTARAATEPKAVEPTVLPSVKGMRIERQGTQRWLVVDQPADKLWPQIVDFWRESGFVLAVEQPAVGLMETDWAENRAKIPQDIVRRTIGKVFDALYSTSERDRFRVRLEPAPGGGTEIYLSHRGMSEEYKDAQRITTVWSPRPSDPDLEAEFLRRLMVKLGATQEVAAKSFEEARAPVQTAARVVQQGDASYVEVPEGFDRAWRRVGLALDRGGFTVEDRDRSKGLYFVRYVDPEVEGKTKSGGLFGWFSTEKKATSAQQYRILVQGAGEASRVSVLGKDGQALASEFDKRTSQKILALLREQLQP